MEQFVTAAVFQYSHEITILKWRLEMEGIAHYFVNETLLNVVPMSSLALGGIQLRVHQNDLPLVNLILEDLQDRDNGLRIV